MHISPDFFCVVCTILPYHLLISFSFIYLYILHAGLLLQYLCCLFCKNSSLIGTSKQKTVIGHFTSVRWQGYSFLAEISKLPNMSGFQHCFPDVFILAEMTEKYCTVHNQPIMLWKVGSTENTRSNTYTITYNV